MGATVEGNCQFETCEEEASDPLWEDVSAPWALCEPHRIHFRFRLGETRRRWRLVTRPLTDRGDRLWFEEKVPWDPL
jgi:hypothetical protein